MIKNLIIGDNLYKDEKSRNILYIKSKNIGYVIKDNDLKKYNLYKNRYILVIIILALLSSSNINILYCIVAGILCVLFLEYNYRNRFLPSLTKIEKFKPKDKNDTIDRFILDGNKNLILAFLYLIFGVLLVVNGFLMNSKISSIIFNIIVMLICIYLFIIRLLAFIKFKKLS